MKRLTVILTSLLVIIMAATTAFAGTSPVIDDKAMLYSEAEKEQLQESIAEAKSVTGWDFVLATTEDTGSYDTRDYSDVEYEQMYVDGNVGADGICFLIDMSSGQFYISTQGAALSYLTDERVNAILDDAFNAYGEDSSFCDAALAVISGAVDYYNAGIPAGQHTVEEEAPLTLGDRILKAIMVLIPSLGVSAAVAAIYTGNIKKQYKMEDVTAAASGVTAVTAAAGAYVFATSTDNLINKNVTQRIIPVTPPAGSGDDGPRTTVHSGPSNGPMHGSMSHGGGGRSFR